MLKQVALVTLADAAPEHRARVRALLAPVAAATRSVVGDTMVSAFGGDIVWQLHFVDEATWRASGAFDRLDDLAAHPSIARIDAAAYVPDPVRLSRPDLRDGVYRALFVHVEPSTSAELEAKWLAEIRRMPAYIPEIANAATGRVIRARGERPWSYVWEQEYDTLDDLRGPYMTNPYHWGFIDRWFDPEMPDRIIDTRLCHSASPLGTSVIVDY